MANLECASEIISRKAAKSLGLKYYFTGVTCKRGHLCKRIVRSAACFACMRVCQKEWRQKNLDHARERDRKYYASNVVKQRDLDRKFYAKNKDKMRAKSRRWYSENKERAQKYARDRYAKVKSPEEDRKNRERSAALRARNPRLVQDRINRWWGKNKDKKKVYNRNRKARIRGNGGSHTAADIADILKSQRGRCAHCREDLEKSKWHVDHIIPLIKMGTNDRRNLQILCQPCNLIKGARDQIDVMRAQGKLL